MISHAEVREALELAAVEPGGLDRLIAGDTPDAGLVAGHLAGCDECTAEFVRLNRSAAILRDTIGLQAPPELKARTLAYVHAVGRPRATHVAAPSAASAVPVGAAASVAARAAAPVAPAATPSVMPATADRPAPIDAGSGTASPPPRAVGRRLREALRPGSPALPWLVATAALVLIAVALTAGIVSNRRDAEDQPRSADAAALAQVAQWSIRIAAQPDSSRVVLASATDPTARGTLQFSPSSGEMVAVADGLAKPAVGQTYSCWVSIGGVRKRLGPMFYSPTGIAYWVGDVALLAHVPTGSTFGVSLSDATGTATSPDPVLAGTL
jgi:hypothetical protein